MVKPFQQTMNQFGHCNLVWRIRGHGARNTARRKWFCQSQPYEKVILIIKWLNIWQRVICINVVFLNIACFHPNWSKGTAAVRGTRILNNGRYFWEIQVSHRVFGTRYAYSKIYWN